MSSVASDLFVHKITNVINRFLNTNIFYLFRSIIKCTWFQVQLVILWKFYTNIDMSLKIQYYNSQSTNHDFSRSLSPWITCIVHLMKQPWSSEEWQTAIGPNSSKLSVVSIICNFSSSACNIFWTVTVKSNLETC